ncbi:hypothetical protein OG936_32795 [Streptomyces sp. NBC_00846]|uniref:hypothetical protein n=1 Tax=Streptomyces sp. NBC_00846 TaxID=2975849 RepID=UPI00386AAD0D|nr:hypothetical protein OG936_32795 [Streptomyces sp. NBC_00846]
MTTEEPGAEVPLVAGQVVEVLAYPVGGRGPDRVPHFRRGGGRSGGDRVEEVGEFSIVQRKIVSPSDLPDLTQVRDRLRACEDSYNAAAQPFHGSFTTSDLDDLPIRLADTHPPTDTKNPPSPWQPDQPPKDFRSRPLRTRFERGQTQ